MGGSRTILRGGSCIGLVAATTAALALLLAWGAEPADAACGDARYAKPSGRIDPAHRPPLAIGDSTMLLAVRPLAAAGFEANARGCRQMFEGLDILRERKRQRRLPRLVIIHLGANAGIRVSQIREAMLILGPKRILGVVTPRPGPHAEAVRTAGRLWPRRVKVLDWVRYHAGHYSWFSGDGLHLSYAGVAAFVRLCLTIKHLNDPPVYRIGDASPGPREQGRLPIVSRVDPGP